MESSSLPIIAGAGPVGLAAAVFLARDGVMCRVIDSAAAPATQSKALAVNPRTLEILEPTGVIEQMLAIGKRIDGAKMALENGKVVEITFEQLKHKYSFMLGLSQAVTVRLLEEAFNRLGGHVERNCELTHCQTNPDGAEATLKTGSDVVTARCPWLLAADGARSAARKALGIDFPGSSYDKPWYLMDVPLATSLEQDRVHVQFVRHGFIFLARVIDDRPAASGVDPLWRVIGTFPDPLSQLHWGQASGEAVWTSTFHISHRINRSMSEGNIYFAGDTAHIHSPMGARGMNLGIEDAWVFSQLHKTGGLARYGKLRHRVDQAVVR